MNKIFNKYKNQINKIYILGKLQKYNFIHFDIFDNLYLYQDNYIKLYFNNI